MSKVYEVTVTKKVEETIIVQGCGTKMEAMDAAIGSAKQEKGSSDFCVKEVKEIIKK